MNYEIIELKKDSQHLLIPPQLRKGLVLLFKTKPSEVILKASNNRETGNIMTNIATYSTDFIYRQIQFGFLKVGKAK